MQALLRYPKHKRRAIAQEWARRSNAVQAKMRMEREPDCETQRFRALHDAKGQVIALVASLSFFLENLIDISGPRPLPPLHTL